MKRLVVVILILLAGGGVYYMTNKKNVSHQPVIAAISCEALQARHDKLPAGTQQIQRSDYWKNAKGVYLVRVDEQRLIEGADPKTFKTFPVVNEFGMDATHVYYAGCPLAVADPSTFQQLPRGTYGRDAQHVYWRWFPLPGANAATFVPLPWDYGKDQYQVYTADKVLEGADVSTFISYDTERSCGTGCTYNAQDKNHKYSIGKIVK